MDELGNSVLNWGYGLLCKCFSIIYDLLTASAIDYSRTNHIYAFMILRSFKAIGLAIVIILTYMSFIRQSSIIIERHPESVFKVLLRAVIVSFLVTNCTAYFGDTFVHGLGMLAKTVFNSAGFYGNDFSDKFSAISLASTAGEITDDTSFGSQIGEFFKAGLKSFFLLIFKLIYVVTMLTTGFHMIVTVFTRFMKIYLYTCTMPIGISFFADPQFSQYGKNYARTYIGACLEGVTIAIAIVLFCGMVGSNMVTKALGTLGDNEFFKYFVYISLLKVMSQTVTQAENFTNKLFGLS